MTSAAVLEALRAFALSFPGAHEDHPWGESVAKVGAKVFVFFGRPPTDETGISISVKLPDSVQQALKLAFAEPTGYGLGKSGWVTARFGPGELPPPGLLELWIEESYRAIAPKKLVRDFNNLPSAANVRK